MKKRGWVNAELWAVDFAGERPLDLEKPGVGVFVSGVLLVRKLLWQERVLLVLLILWSLPSL